MKDYTPTKEERDMYKSIQDNFKRFEASRIKIRKCTYSGKGRPRNDDYIVLPINMVQDYRNYERLMNGFTTHYVK